MEEIRTRMAQLIPQAAKKRLDEIREAESHSFTKKKRKLFRTFLSAVARAVVIKQDIDGREGSNYNFEFRGQYLYLVAVLREASHILLYQSKNKKRAKILSYCSLRVYAACDTVRVKFFRAKVSVGPLSGGQMRPEATGGSGGIVTPESVRMSDGI